MLSQCYWQVPILSFGELSLFIKKGKSLSSLFATMQTSIVPLPIDLHCLASLLCEKVCLSLYLALFLILPPPPTVHLCVHSFLPSLFAFTCILSSRVLRSLKTFCILVRFDTMYCRLGGALKKLLFQERFSDFQVLVGEEPIFTHRAILACRSPFFRDLFLEGEARDSWGGKQEREKEKGKNKEEKAEAEVGKQLGREMTLMKMNKESKGAVELVLRWIYTDGFFPSLLKESLLNEVKDLATQWQLHRLVAICEAFLQAPSWKHDREALQVTIPFRLLLL